MSNKSRARKNRHKTEYRMYRLYKGACNNSTTFTKWLKEMRRMESHLEPPTPAQKLHFADLDINLMYPWTIESLANLK